MIEVSPEAGVEPMGLDLAVADGVEMRFAFASLQQSLHWRHKPLLLFLIECCTEPPVRSKNSASKRRKRRPGGDTTAAVAAGGRGMFDKFSVPAMWRSNHRGLSVLIHPETGDDPIDHLDHTLWLGNQLPLDIEYLRRLGRRA
jgi:hypothetical protein